MSLIPPPNNRPTFLARVALQGHGVAAASALRLGAVPDAAALRGVIKPPTFGPNNFMLGTNLPWVNYGGDFGASPWQPTGGLASNEAAREKLEQTFSKLASDNTPHVRWWLFADGRSGIEWGEDGTPLGIDNKLFADMDAGLAAARRHGIKITFALIDFLFAKGNPKTVGAKAGGHADVLKDPTKRQAFIKNVLEPVFERYGRDPAIEAWDLMNEPEWVTFPAAAFNPFTAVSRAAMRQYFSEATGAVHRHTQQWATVGLATTKGLDLARGHGLDLYHAHWYADHSFWIPKLKTPVKDFRLDRPLILGEFPLKSSAMGVTEILDTAQKAGYGGVMSWSVLSDDKFAGYDSARDLLSKWRNDHAEDLAP